MLRQLAMACALVCVALPACAQTPERGVQRGMTVELGGGFAYTEFNSSGWPNAHGVYGSIGINVTPWLQVYADGAEQWGSLAGGNTTLYGDHLGARYYYRPRYEIFNPFAEGLIGVSRLDLKVTQPPSKFSENGFSFKVGGGLDLVIDRHWSVRALDADYYRTPFFQTHQNNLWISAGVIFRFGESRYPH